MGELPDKNSPNRVIKRLDNPDIFSIVLTNDSWQMLSDV